jgi:hypothetical protein
MRNIDSTLGHHLHQVTVAELISNVPSDAHNDDRVIEVTTAKEREGGD